MSDEFTLTIGGVKHAGWTDLSITRGLDQLAHTFNVRLTDKWSDQDERIQIVAGSSVVVKYGSLPVITGYIDDDSMNYDAGQRSIAVSGRSKTSDLVDCAAVLPTKRRSWRKTGLLDIALEICDPFGINAYTRVDLGAKFSRFTIEDGETAFSCLQRAARMRGVLMLTDSQGELVFDRAGEDSVTPTLKFGENIIRAQHRRSLRDRFSEYRVEAQVAGGDELNAKQVTIRRTSTDDAINRYRPTVVMADQEDSGAELQKRADWEANTRAGQSRTVDYVVRGWECDQGLWEPNSLVRVIDPTIWFDGELLISAVTFDRSGGGTTTTLSLTEKRAFDVQPLFTKPAAQKTQSNWLGALGI